MLPRPVSSPFRSRKNLKPPRRNRVAHADRLRWHGHRKQAKQLDADVDVIVGTPGRVMDMSERGHIELTKPTMFILDEADRMLDMGFFPDICGFSSG